MSIKPYAIEINIEAGSVRYHFRDGDDVVVSRHSIAQTVRDEVAQAAIADPDSMKDTIDEIKGSGVDTMVPKESAKYDKHVENLAIDKMAVANIDTVIEGKWLEEVNRAFYVAESKGELYGR